MTTIKSFCKCVVPDNVFRESSPPRSLEEKQLRAKRTFEEMMSYIPGMQPAVSYPDFCPRSTSETSCAARQACEINRHLSFRLPGEMYGRRGQVWGNMPPLWWIAAADSKQAGRKAQGRPAQTNLYERPCLLVSVHLWPPAGKGSTWPLNVSFTVNSLFPFCFCLLSSCSVDVCAVGHRHSRTFSRAEQGKSTHSFFSVDLNVHSALDMRCASLGCRVKGGSWSYF